MPSTYLQLQTIQDQSFASAVAKAGDLIENTREELKRGMLVGLQELWMKVPYFTPNFPGKSQYCCLTFNIGPKVGIWFFLTSRHGNARIQERKIHYSITQYSAGSVYQWLDYGGYTRKELKKEDERKYKEHKGRWICFDNGGTLSNSYLSSMG
ncbi:hypothetical protein L218DRAFT_949509 [Marasmius fiardii PR-910]|nr:hypothetical protein L218DRAFT_949509 [Marasmius fiardii PR-910]